MASVAASSALTAPAPPQRVSASDDASAPAPAPPPRESTPPLHDGALPPHRSTGQAVTEAAELLPPAKARTAR
jgi:hypothetical protein